MGLERQLLSWNHLVHGQKGARLQSVWEHLRGCWPPVSHHSSIREQERTKWVLQLALSAWYNLGKESQRGIVYLGLVHEHICGGLSELSK